MGTESRLCSRGLKLPKSSVNTLNARSIGASTTIDCLMGAADTRMLIAGLHSFFDGRLVSCQRAAPEPVKPGAHLADSRWIDVINVAGPLWLGTNQTRFAQHLQMLGDGRLGDCQFSGDFNDRARPRTHQFEYSSAGRI